MENRRIMIFLLPTSNGIIESVAKMYTILSSLVIGEDLSRNMIAQIRIIAARGKILADI
jgi:hypothetical protein